jgi:DNA-binding NtrC family response regulator
MSPDKNKVTQFRVSILEDNVFYNTLLRSHIRNYFDAFPLLYDCQFSVTAFTSAHDFISNLGEHTDVVLMDFYLDNGSNALSVLKRIKEKTLGKCKIVIISGCAEVAEYFKSAFIELSDFIVKDLQAPDKTCKVLEAICFEKIRGVS